MNKKITSILIIVNLLLIPIMLYFKYSLNFINPLITNISIFLMLFSLIFLIVYGILISNNSKEIYLFFIPSMIFAFLVRSIPNLVMNIQPLHDSYFYYTCTLNIIETGTITPFLTSWYPNIGDQLQWPLMQILNVCLFYMTNINLTQLLKFQEPFMGVIFFLGIFILAKVTTKNDKIAIIAALIATFTDSVIFYQAEFHPQGFAFVLFAFLIYAFIKSRIINKMSFRLLTLIFALSFILSHHFSSIFLGLLCISYIIFIEIFSITPYIKETFKKVSGDLKKDITLFILIAVSAIAYHLYVTYSLLQNFIESSLDTSPGNALIYVGGAVPLTATILNSVKWITLILALISILWVFKTKKPNQIRLMTFFLCIISAGVVGQFVISGPIDRFIGFYIVVASIFASLTLYYWYEKPSKSRKFFPNSLTQNKKILIVTLLTTIIIISGVLNSQTPSYFFKDSGTSDFYYYSNIIPAMDEYSAAGNWMNETISTNTKDNSKFGTEFDTRIIPFYFASVPYNNIQWAYQTPQSYKELLNDNYILINPKIPYQYSNKSNYEVLDKVYDNGIYLYSNQNII